MVYNYTNLTNANDFIGIMQFVNQETSGWLGFLILIAIFIITMASLQYFETRRATTSAIFITLILANILSLFSLISDTILMGTWIVAGIVAIGWYASKDQY